MPKRDDEREVFKRLFATVESLGELEMETWVVPEDITWKVIDEEESQTGYFEVYVYGEERRLGLAYLEERPDGIVWLDLIQVFPPAQGQGLGKKILRFVEAHWKARGFREIQGEVISCKYTPSSEDCDRRAEWFGARGFDCRRQGGVEWSVVKRFG